MKILFLSQYFPPETGANSSRVYSFADYFARSGHDVTVICEFPNYPGGKLDKKHWFRFFKTESMDNFRVIRTAVIPSARSNVLSRLLNYFSFFLSSLIVGLFLKRQDLIVVTSPPPTVGLSAVILGILKSTPVIGDIQDLWPEYAIALGVIKNRAAIGILNYLTSIFYRQCSAMTTISIGIRDDLKSRISPDIPIEIIHNGSFIPDSTRLDRIHVNGYINEITNVCYAGQIGICQKIDDIIAAAEITKSDGSIIYTLIGDGVKKDHYQKIVNEKGLSNVVFAGLLSLEETMNALIEADIGVVTLEGIDLFKAALPTKLFDYMAAGLPVLLNVDGEARELVETYKTGLYFSPGSPSDLVRHIRFIQQNESIAREMGMAGRKLAENSFSREKLAADMERFAANLISSGGEILSIDKSSANRIIL